MKNYYKILEVNENASQAQIKRAYRTLAKKYHPDKSSSVHAEQLFTQINEAYEVLSDPVQKSRYDQKDIYQPPSPQYRRRPRPAPSYRPRPKQDLDLKPYVHYFRIVSIVGLVFSLLLLADFVIPRKVFKDQVVQIENVVGASRTGRRFVIGKKVTTEKVTFEIDKNESIRLFEHQPVEIRKTAGLGIITSIDFISNDALVRYSFGASIYGNFSFAWIILLITSLIGLYRKISSEMTLNFSIVNGILTILVLYFTLVS